MKKIKLIHLLLSVAIAFPAISYSQIKYAVHANYGFSNFIEKNKESSIVIGNTYSKLPSYTIGGSLFYPIKDSRFLLKTGIDYSSFSAKNTMDKDFADSPDYIGPSSWTEKFHSLSIPIIVRFKFEKWIFVSVGLSNTFHLNEPDEIYCQKINHYSLSFSGGIDFLIKQKIIIGLNYYRNLTPTMQMLQLPITTETYNIKYYIEQISLKVGYIIN